MTAAEALERLGRSSLHEMAMKGLLHTVADLAKTRDQRPGFIDLR